MGNARRKIEKIFENLQKNYEGDLKKQETIFRIDFLHISIEILYRGGFKKLEENFRENTM